MIGSIISIHPVVKLANSCAQKVTDICAICLNIVCTLCSEKNTHSHFLSYHHQ